MTKTPAKRTGSRKTPTAANLAALTSLFTDDSVRLRAGAPGAGISVTTATSGGVVLEWSGRALDSRRDPKRAAAVAASDVTASTVVIAGLMNLCVSQGRV